MRSKPFKVAGSTEKAQEVLSRISGKKVNPAVVKKPSVDFLVKRFGMSRAAALKLLGG